MSDNPVVDGRTRDDIRDEIAEMAPFYTDQWDPDAGGPGAALVALYAELAEDVIERLDRAPEMHRAAFFDELGFGQRPPQPASAPLAFTIADGASDNVTISAGTRAVAAATDNRPEQSFRIGPEDAFEATPSNLTAVYSVDPGSDHIAEHLDRLDSADSSPLFEGDDEQRHVCTIGHAKRLTLGPGASLNVEVETDLPKAAVQSLTWEYYGKRPDQDEADWNELTPRGSSGGGDGGGWDWPYPFPGGPWELPFDPGRIDFGGLDIPMVDAPSAGSGTGAGGTQSLADRLSEAGYALTERRPSVPQRRLLSAAMDQRSDRDRRAVTDAISKLFPDDEAANIVTEYQRRRVADILERHGARHGGSGGNAGGSGHSGNDSDGDDSDENVIDLDFELDGTIESTTVAGTESNWIRCRIPDDIAWNQYLDTGMEPVAVGTERDGMEPDAMYANDVPQPRESDGMTLPFGETPRQLDAFHIGSSEAFTKGGATVVVDITTAPGLGIDGVPGGRFPGGGFGGGSNIPGGVGGPGVLDDVDLSDFLGDNFGSSGQGGNHPIVDGSGKSTSPSVSWEYWNGDGWTTLPDLEYENESGSWESVSKSDGSELAFLTDASLQFTVPDDLTETKVGGHDGHWIRARFVGGQFITRSFEATGDAKNPESWEQTTTGTIPVLESIELDYEQNGPPEDIVTTNNLETTSRDLDTEKRMVPFTGPAVDAQTVYFGFDGPLRDGPITLFVDVTDRAYPEDFYPRFRWEYCVDPAEDEWARLDVQDETEGLTERGVISLVFPEDTTATPRFGAERHWVRARTTNDEFTYPLVVESDRPRERAQSRDDRACGDAIETHPARGFPRKRPPELTAIHPNVGWAENVQHVTDEVLGTSDGTPAQAFTPTQQPVLYAGVWVDELATLSGGRRERLQDEDPERVSVETNSAGDLQAFWVRWERVDDFLRSDRNDRHFVLEPASGTIRFGDGSRGRIPPQGSDNVRATYTTGGGSSGNVPAGTIADLKSSVAFVDAVTNPIAADGGADAETNTDVVERAPKQLRDRNRAVTEADIERIALDSARKLARARCLPAMNRSGDHEPGWVTLLVVPDSPRPKPTPSISLREQVRDAVSARAPLTLVDPERLVVRGPGYVQVTVEADLVVGGPSVGAVEDRAEDAVADYCHPLTGDIDGSGWSFGEIPCRSDCYALLEGVAGVDHVTDLTINISANGTTTTLEEDEPAPSVSADAMVYGDTHEIRVRRSDTGHSGLESRRTDGGDPGGTRRGGTDGGRSGGDR